MSADRVLEVGCDLAGHRVAELSEEIDGFLPVFGGSIERAKVALGAAEECQRLGATLAVASLMA